MCSFPHARGFPFTQMWSSVLLLLLIRTIVLLLSFWFGTFPLSRSSVSDGLAKLVQRGYKSFGLCHPSALLVKRVNGVWKVQNVEKSRHLLLIQSMKLKCLWRVWPRFCTKTNFVWLFQKANVAKILVNVRKGWRGPRWKKPKIAIFTEAPFMVKLGF